MLLSFVKKIILALSLWSLIILQPVAAASEIVDLYAGQSRTVGNLTLRCVGNSASSASNSTDYGTLALTNLVNGMITSVCSVMFWPTVKACLKDTCNKCCGIPRCCRRQSTEDMDIRVDLLDPAPARNYRLLFENLDASLVNAGWGKCPVIDEDERLAGYRYLFSGDDGQEKASIWFLREYQTLQAQKGLLRLNKSLQSRAFKVGTLKNIYETEVGLSSDKSYYLYESGHGRKILREKSFQQSASQRGANTSNNSSSINSDSDTFLQRFNQAFSRYTSVNAQSVNAQRFFEETLELY